MDSTDAIDARRYRALATRHAYRMVTNLLGENGYSSVTSRAKIDAFADEAAAEVEAWDALTPEQRQAARIARISELEEARRAAGEQS